jgi:hypothetical protein
MSLAEYYDVVVYIVYYIVVTEMLRHRSVYSTTSYVHIIYNSGVYYDIVYDIGYDMVITRVLLAHSIIVPCP